MTTYRHVGVGGSGGDGDDSEQNFVDWVFKETYRWNELLVPPLPVQRRLWAIHNIKDWTGGWGELMWLQEVMKSWASSDTITQPVYDWIWPFIEDTVCILKYLYCQAGWQAGRFAGGKQQRLVTGNFATITNSTASSLTGQNTQICRNWAPTFYQVGPENQHKILGTNKRTFPYVVRWLGQSLLTEWQRKT